MYVSINGNIVRSTVASISPLSQGFAFGYGLFETIKVEGKKLVFVKEHIDRLMDSLKKLNIEISEDFNNIEKYCNDLIQLNDIDSGALKIIYAKDLDNYNLVISTRENPYNNERRSKGFTLCFSDIKRNPYSPLTYVKSNNYLENILARQEVHSRGFDEGIFLNVYDKLCEGTISNLFFIKDKVVFTPSIECGLLPGIMRGKIIGLIKSLGYDIITGEFKKDDLLKADEVFITNSLMDIMPVYKIEDKVLLNNPITISLMENLRNI